MEAITGIVSVITLGVGYATAKLKDKGAQEAIQAQAAANLLERVKVLEALLEEYRTGHAEISEKHSKCQVECAVCKEKLTTKLKRIGFLEKELKELKAKLEELEGEDE